MNWLTSLQDHLPVLLVLSPVIGFIVTGVAARIEPKLIPHLALANLVCTLVILMGLVWHYESNLAAETDIIRIAQQQFSLSDDGPDSLAHLLRKLDRMRTERLRDCWFTVDGINLFPVLLVVVVTMIGVWRIDSIPRQANWQIPLLMLFESATLGILTTCDLKIFLFLTTVSAVTMSLLISQGGNSSRRQLSELFLLSQFAGGALITLGFSMLAVSIPWMKLPDSTTIPDLSWQIFTITAEIQKWTARSELAFHYESEFFPWILLVLLFGFGIQSGLFPFHFLPIRIVSESHPVNAVLYLTGSVSACRIAWFRFVLPLAPDLLASFDNWMVIPSFVGAVWGGLFALAPLPPRQRVAWIFTALSSLAFAGCYTMTRFGMNGAWLMQQQLTVLTCAVLLGFDSLGSSGGEKILKGPGQISSLFSSRNLLLFISLPVLGLFASSYLILSALILESLLLSGIVFVVGISILAAILLLLRQHALAEQRDGCVSTDSGWIPGPFLTMTVLAIVTSVFPGLLLHQSNSEFVRLFRRFEQSTTANSAEIPSNEPQDDR